MGWKRRRSGRLGDSTPGADDHVASDVLPQDAVRASDVVLALGYDRRRLEAEPVLANRACRLVDDLVLRGPPVVEREVSARKLELEADDVGGQNAQRLFKQLLPRRPFQDHDRARLHGA